MKKLAITLCLVTATVAHAECYTRSAMTNQIKAKLERIADLKRSVVPTPEGQKRCTVSFRALINGDWHNAEGMSQAMPDVPEDQLCARAVQSGRTFLLQNIQGSNMAAEQEMVCSDEPKPEVKMVKVGDVIAESEVQPHLRYNKPFVYRGSVCRWFSQSSDQTEGVMCKIRDTQWKVVDKF
jgi:hypothetical protein